jgi:hypothetical protein
MERLLYNGHRRRIGTYLMLFIVVCFMGGCIETVDDTVGVRGLAFASAS